MSLSCLNLNSSLNVNFCLCRSIRGKKVTRATSSRYCLYLYFWFNFFSPWTFWFHQFCLGLIGLAFFYCSPSSHFVFSILSLEAMSRPAVGTPLSPIGPTAALSLQLTLRPLNISMFQVGAGTVCVFVSCHSVECSLCNFCLVSIVSRCLPWGAPSGFGTVPGLAERSSALRNVGGGGGSLWFLPILLFRYFTVRMPWFSGSVGGLWAGYELCRAWFFSQLHQLSTSITANFGGVGFESHAEKSWPVSHYIWFSFRLL